jgi:hypothetical protein
LSHTEAGSQDVPEHVFQKLAGLMSMADAARSKSPEEAAIAAAKVQRFLFRWNLTAAQAKKASGKKEAEDKTANFTKHAFYVGSKTPWLTEWKTQLLYSVARNNFCRPLHGAEGEVTLIGQPLNVKISIQLYEYLAKEINRLAIAAWKATEDDYWARKDTHERKFRSSFCAGAVTTINARLAALKKEQQADLTQDESGLMLHEDELLNEAFYTYYPYMRPPSAEQLAKWKKEREEKEAEARKKALTQPPVKVKKSYYQPKGTRRSSFDDNAYYAGSDAARDINLDKQISR